MKVKIRELAEKKGWSLYRLAVNMGLPGQTVFGWANGRTQPSYANMDKLCSYLDCTMGDLFESEPVETLIYTRQIVIKEALQ